MLILIPEKRTKNNKNSNYNQTIPVNAGDGLGTFSPPPPHIMIYE